MKTLEQIMCPECDTENIDLIGTKHDNKNFALGLAIGSGAGVAISVTTGLAGLILVPAVVMGAGFYLTDAFYNPIEEYNCKDCEYNWEYQEPKEYK
jgi:hypothetical protein